MSSCVEQFTVSQISSNQSRTPSMYGTWDEAISVIFDSMNRKDMIISESNDAESNYNHTFRFNEDAKVVSVDHNCFDGESCKYHNLELMNR